MNKLKEMMNIVASSLLNGRNIKYHHLALAHVMTFFSDM
jgi:hypothetical protein